MSSLACRQVGPIPVRREVIGAETLPAGSRPAATQAKLARLHALVKVG